MDGELRAKFEPKRSRFDEKMFTRAKIRLGDQFGFLASGCLKMKIFGFNVSGCGFFTHNKVQHVKNY